MECPRRSNYGTGVDRMEMSFDRKSYVHGKHHQLLTMKENMIHERTLTHICILHIMLCSQKCHQKRESDSLENEQFRLCLKIGKN